jgi:hypothetical protein
LGVAAIFAFELSAASFYLGNNRASRSPDGMRFDTFQTIIVKTG